MDELVIKTSDDIVKQYSGTDRQLVYKLKLHLQRIHKKKDEFHKLVAKRLEEIIVEKSS
jgi:hypothetical protein